MYADNLLNVTQNFLSPDIVNRFSSVIGESTEKTQVGLKSVVPSLLMGIVNKGQTSDGAERLVRLVNKDGFEGESVSNYNDENYLSMGNDAVTSIFEGNVDQVATNLGETTGIQSSRIKQLMALAAPLLMGLLGKKMKREGLNANGLMGFLNREKSSLSKLVPEGLVGRLSSTEASREPKIHRPVQRVRSITPIRDDIRGGSPWLIIGLVALGILALAWWYTGSRNLTDVRSTPGSVLTSRDNVITRPLEGNLPAGISSVNELSTFMASDSLTLPKAFVIDNLSFDGGAATIVTGAERELDQIAEVMKRYPSMTARIDGHTFNTGNEASNVVLSSDRALAVKDELVLRGVEAERLVISGMGSSKPIDTNNSEAGRAQNERIEFVVLSK